jgi:hypothetical protein
MERKDDRIDGVTVFLGFVVGYALFASFLFLYWKTRQGGVDSNYFGWRLFTPFILIKFQWTDFACYALILLSVLGIAKTRNQI